MHYIWSYFTEIGQYFTSFRDDDEPFWVDYCGIPIPWYILIGLY